MRVFPKKAGVDPKLVSDQLGYGLGVNLDVYTIAGLDERLEAVHGEFLIEATDDLRACYHGECAISSSYLSICLPLLFDLPVPEVCVP
jgi:hypothetical protein